MKGADLEFERPEAKHPLHGLLKIEYLELIN